ncbi:MAG: SpaA isopeptide-forming pilin-related protein, partial [Ruminococcus sp.]
ASDLYANNSFYYVESALDSSQGVSSGVSDALQTAIISRDVSGFSWFDSNGNGAIDNDEPKLRNVRVKLYQYDAYAPEGQKYIDTGLETTTDKDGRYVFTNVPSATYAVRFMAPESGVVYINDSNNALAFSKLSQTLVYSETQENCDDHTLETGVTTHNISKGIDTTPKAEENDKIYIFSTPNFYVPSDYSVYTMTNQTAGKNAVWNKFQYSRVFLNAGFNLKNYYSLSLDHTNALGDPLNGVKYKLLYLNEADNTWYPVYYSTISSGENETLEIKCMSSDLKTEADLTNDNIQYIFSTDASGILQFPNLLNGKYRLYQITDDDGFITDGYLGFESDYLEFDLPNKVLKSEFDNKSIDGTYYQSLSDDSKVANISKSVDKNNLFEDVNDTENYYFRNTNLSIENKLYSISVTKQCYDEETQEYLPLQGASFRLERKENNEWVTVSDGEESEKTTDSSGVISFANLLPGSYRLVETKTPDGYLKLQNPIECIELPYAVTGTSYTDEENYTDISNADYELAVNNKNLLKKVSGKSYYGHVGMTVINQNSQFTLPTTGFNGLFITVAFGIVAFAGAITLFILSKKRKGKGKNSTINQ